MAGRPRDTELRTRVLSILARGETYGYVLAEELRRTDTGLDLPEGSVYPALRRLERDGLASGRWVEVGTDVPRRRYYVLTPQGLAELTGSQTAPQPAARRLGELRQ
jgi:PadR family transcriptional regulator PadR